MNLSIGILPGINLARPSRDRSSADFQVCCIVGFQTRQPLPVARPRRFGNRRYSRFGNLRYDQGVASSQNLRKLRKLLGIEVRMRRSDDLFAEPLGAMQRQKSVSICVHLWFSSLVGFSGHGIQDENSGIEPRRDSRQ